MTRAEAVNWLTNIMYDIGKSQHRELWHYEQALAEIKKMLEEQPQWISCSEMLPEPEKKRYWVCTDGGYQCQCRWTNINHFWTDLTTDWHWHIGDVPQYSKVVAWMPLPTPYMTADD